MGLMDFFTPEAGQQRREDEIMRAQAARLTPMLDGLTQ